MPKLSEQEIEILESRTKDLARDIQNGTLRAREPMRTLGTRLREHGRIPDPPEGIKLTSWPRIMDATGGIWGLWALGGMPGVGKSTFALQAALGAAHRGMPVVYYDFENSDDVLLRHAGAVLRGDTARLQVLTDSIWYRSYIDDLLDDMKEVPPPALVIVDSVQKLPIMVEHRRVRLDQWIRRCEALKVGGYTVLLLSEMPRSSYGSEAYIGAFKETSEIEYSADVGAQLIPVSDDEVEFHIVKNRHHKTKGKIVTLRRVHNWKWVEVDE